MVEDGKETTLSVSGIHLSSCYDREAEAQLQTTLIPEDAASCWVYGMGLGDLPLALLQRKNLKQISVVLLNAAIARLSLSCIDHSSWLKDPRVELLAAEQLDGLKIPFAAVPPELQLAEDSAAYLRDLVVLELSTPYIHEKQGVESTFSQERIRGNRPFIVNDGDVADLFGLQAGKRILVAAAGPTPGRSLCLDQTAERHLADCG